MWRLAKYGYDEVKDKKDKIDKFLNPVPGQPNLKHFLGDFYATPPEPQAPNYDDPFSDMPIGFEIEIVRDDCNLGIQITGVLAFMRLPAFQFVWRNPKCNPRKDPFELPKIQKFSLDSDILFELKYSPYAISCDEELNFFKSHFSSNLYIQILRIEGITITTYDSVIGLMSRWEGSIIYRAKRKDTINGEVTLLKEGIYKGCHTQSGWNVHPNSNYRGGETLDGDDDEALKSIPETNRWTVQRSQYVAEEDYDNYINNIEQEKVFKRKSYDVVYAFNYIASPPAIRKITEAKGTTFLFFTGGNFDVEPDKNYNIEFKCDTPLPPPPSPPMKSDCCDELKEMLALLIKRVGNLPALVPDLFTKVNPELIKKESIAELIIWQAKQLDAISGKYPLFVEIQDIDPAKKGNQSKTVQLPNQAELLGDMYQTILTMKQINEALLPVALKTLVEVGSVKLTALSTHDLAYGNADFLGWDISHRKHKVKFSFNPTADPDAPMSELLEQKEIDVKGYENKDKKDLRTWLVPIARMASAWMAQNFRKVPNKETFRVLLGDKPDALIDQAEKESKTEEDFDVFIESVEKGFIGKPGITDTINPYGKPFEERPKIREFGGESTTD